MWSWLCWNAVGKGKFIISRLQPRVTKRLWSNWGGGGTPLPHMKRIFWKAKIPSLYDGCLERKFPSYIKRLGVICILLIIRTDVIRQAENVRRQLNNTDRIRKGHDQCQNVLQRTTLRQLLHWSSNHFKQLHHTKRRCYMQIFRTLPLKSLIGRT